MAYHNLAAHTCIFLHTRTYKPIHAGVGNQLSHLMSLAPYQYPKLIWIFSKTKTNQCFYWLNFCRASGAEIRVHVGFKVRISAAPTGIIFLHE